MPSDSVKLPQVSPAIFRFFRRYTASYLRRHFHSIRLAQRSAATPLKNFPLIVCLNHPSWWDPLVCLQLATSVFPEHSHYAPIEAAALARYRIFERIGFFGVQANA